jgi:hypothetical protein
MYRSNDMDNNQKSVSNSVAAGEQYTGKHYQLAMWLIT